ncbi:hypothetical protein [Serratia fonticola]|uniref:hypothetical protein n=1 Tax=Serratia fonticola TaxID=47917 RepID=UPI00301E0B38
MNQAEFARLHEVSRKTVTMWKSQGFLVINEDGVDVEASNANLKKHRDTVTQQAKKKVKTGQTTTSGNSVKANKERGNTSRRVPEPTTGNAQRKGSQRRIVIDNDNRNSPADFDGIMPDDLMSYNDARTLKENYLALMAKQEFEKKENNLVEMELAKDVLFSVFRQQRDAWLNWPARIAPLLAADFNVPADRMTEVLSEYVHQHITQLGNPEFIPLET